MRVVYALAGVQSMSMYWLQKMKYLLKSMVYRLHFYSLACLKFISPVVCSSNGSW